LPRTPCPVTDAKSSAVSRARDSVTVYTDDKARLAETIQSSGARMTAHELLEQPVRVNVIDPFESMLCEKVSIPVPEPASPATKPEKVRPTESRKESPQIKPFNYFELERPKGGISL
jgi:hypothetical protein